jgi:hypothetical protein
MIGKTSWPRAGDNGVYAKDAKKGKKERKDGERKHFGLPEGRRAYLPNTIDLAGLPSMFSSGILCELCVLCVFALRF